jgi:large subunit ribosomal protein L3
MTRVFTDEGNSVPVTVIEASPNRVTQVKNADTDGYNSVQVTIGTRRANLVNKPVAGHYAKAGVEAGEGLWELRMLESEEVEAGAELKVDMFEAGELVDVTGTSKGKGFAGAVKRHNFRMQDATHGNSLAHRAPGSIGQCQTPGRVFKGKKMAGHMGDERVTTQNLEVVRVDSERNLILIKGAVPGAAGGAVVVRPSVKANPVKV